MTDPRIDDTEIPWGEKEDIFVAIPSLDANVNIGVMRFLLTLQQASMAKTSPWKFSYYVVNGKRPVEYARNLLAGAFLEQSNASRMWFIDQDMMPGENAHELLLAEADIVAGRMFAFDHAHDGKPPALKLCAFHFNVNGDHRFNCAAPKEGDDISTPMEVDAVGTASMLIRRNVLEDRRLWADGAFTYFDGAEYDCSAFSTDKDAEGFAPPIFKTIYKPNGKILRGEDLDFCRRAGEFGYAIKADLSVTFGHHKAVNLDEVAELCQIVADRVEKKAVSRLQLVGAGA